MTSIYSKKHPVYFLFYGVYMVFWLTESCKRAVFGGGNCWRKTPNPANRILQETHIDQDHSGYNWSTWWKFKSNSLETPHSLESENWHQQKIVLCIYTYNIYILYFAEGGWSYWFIGFAVLAFCSLQRSWEKQTQVAWVTVTQPEPIQL